MSSRSDFVIENDILKKYDGPGGDVVIPDGVTAIGDYAFYNCTSLTSVHIPDSVTSISGTAFYGCQQLADAQGFVIVRNVLYSYHGKKRRIRIPDGVTSIGDEAFWGCRSLISVHIPDSVTSIGCAAFYGCEKLANLRGFVIVRNVLYSYHGPCRSIRIPDGVIKIGDLAFRWCENLTSVHIPYGVIAIGARAFGECGSLTSVHLPDTLTTIGEEAFAYCGNLTDVQIPDRVTSIGNSAFYGCKKLADAQGFVIIQNVLQSYHGNDFTVCIPDGVTTVGQKAFRGCRHLTDLRIPDSVTSIGDEAFSCCQNLTRIAIPDSVTAIGAEAFFRCSSLSGITLPDRMTSIGNWAFSACHSLTSIVLPDSVTSIGSFAFCNCNRLTVRWLGTGTIGEDAFSGVSCAILPRIPFADFTDVKSKRAAVLGFLRNMDLYTDTVIRTAYVKYAIGQRKKLLPEIFAEDCVSALTFYAEQKKITAANFDAEYLTPVLEADATGCVAFLLDWKNKHLTQEDVDKQLEKELLKDPFNVADMKKLWSYKTLEDGTLMLTSYKGNETEVYVPERVGKKSVTALGAYIFSPETPSGASKPESRKIALEQIHVIILPDSVTTIGENAFGTGTDLTIHASAGSSAETYAKEYNIPFAVK